MTNDKVAEASKTKEKLLVEALCVCVCVASYNVLVLPRTTKNQACHFYADRYTPARLPTGMAQARTRQPQSTSAKWLSCCLTSFFSLMFVGWRRKGAWVDDGAGFTECLTNSSRGDPLDSSVLQHLLRLQHHHLTTAHRADGGGDIVLCDQVCTRSASLFSRETLPSWWTT